jgi:hypothetical protein
VKKKIHISVEAVLVSRREKLRTFWGLGHHEALAKLFERKAARRTAAAADESVASAHHGSLG